MGTQQYRTKDGKRVKGVTTILGVLNKPALMFWAYGQGLENYNRITEHIAKLCDVDERTDPLGAANAINEIRATMNDFQIGSLYEKRDKAATAGTLAHLFVENHLKDLPEPSTQGMSVSIVNKAQGCYLAFLEWERSHKFKLLHSELPLVSEVHRFGGTIDIGAVVGEMGIVDIKTSKGVYYNMLFQISAYGHLYNEYHEDHPIQGYHIIRLGEEGDFEHKYYPALEDEWEIFLACLKIQNILDKKGQKL